MHTGIGFSWFFERTLAKLPPSKGVHTQNSLAARSHPGASLARAAAPSATNAPRLRLKSFACALCHQRAGADARDEAVSVDTDEARGGAERVASTRGVVRDFTLSGFDPRPPPKDGLGCLGMDKDRQPSPGSLATRRKGPGTVWTVFGAFCL